MYLSLTELSKVKDIECPCPSYTSCVSMFNSALPQHNQYNNTEVHELSFIRWLEPYKTINMQFIACIIPCYITYVNITCIYVCDMCMIMFICHTSVSSNCFIYS